jgi:zinc protease
MKRLLIIILLITSLVPLYAQIDRTTAPEPGPAPLIQIGDYHTFSLDNGMKVIVVENDKVPVISFQLTLDIDPVMENEAKGYVSFAGSLMRSGTASRSKAEIDDEVDFIGASLSTFSTGMFASSLTRHADKLLDLMSDILMNPVFPEDELKRETEQTLTGLSATVTDAGAMVNNISTVLVYGQDHPYGEVMTPESVSNIERQMIVDYYDTYFKSNVAYMVIVGDIKTARARELMDLYFSAWQPGEVPTHSYEMPLPPDGNKVAFADRAGAVQSVVTVAYPVKLRPGDPDAIKASVMNSLLGGGVFSGRLMQNLREEKGYTYGAYSNLSSDRLVGRFSVRTEVRNSVTDNTVEEILNEMEGIINEPPDQPELELIKNFINGSFARSLESPRTIANFALNIERFGLPENYYTTYLERLSLVSPDDVQEAARKYIKPQNNFIIVSGNKSEVAGNLEKFSSTGEVWFFDPFGRRIEQSAASVPEGYTAEDVINHYAAATGGADKLRELKDISMHIVLTMPGMSIDMATLQKAPGMYKMTLTMDGNVIQQQIFDGTRGRISGMQGAMELEGEMLEEMKLQSVMNPELTYIERGYKLTLDGIETINGREAYKLIVITPRNTSIQEFYGIECGLKLRMVASQDSPMGPVTQITDYGDYREVGNLKFPFRIRQQTGPQSMELAVQSVELNLGLNDELFSFD